MIANRIRECADDITGIAQRNGTPDEKTAAVNAHIDRFFDDLADHLKGSPDQDGKKEIDALRYTLANAAAKFAWKHTKSLMFSTGAAVLPSQLAHESPAAKRDWKHT